jgi:dGTPase
MDETTTPREREERLEEQLLHPHAARAARSAGRTRREEHDDVRTAFQRDRDRVLHSKPFRRLKGKTQVFLSPEGDHYRTRMTHTLEVSQIARTIGRALRLNEDLVEAVSLAHDLGHTPFGHAGEDALRRFVPDFHHATQSLRVVDVLAAGGRGLNLTQEVRAGILRHSKGLGPILPADGPVDHGSLEAEVVRVSDLVAYVNHDLDDASRADLLADFAPAPIVAEHLRRSYGDRIGCCVRGILGATDLDAAPHLRLPDEIAELLEQARGFLFANVYQHPLIASELTKARALLCQLWEHIEADPGPFLGEAGGPLDRGVPLRTAIADFLAGMTDAYALTLFDRLIVPKRWFVGPP